MKKLLLLIIASCNFIVAQTKLSGEYISNDRNAKGIKMQFLDDKKFALSFMNGTYEQKNDSIFFHSEIENSPLFNLKYTFSKDSPKSIKINFSERGIYNFDKIFIGVQKNANSTVEYKSLKEYTNQETPYDDEKEVNTFTIDKVNFIYLVDYSKDRESVVEKYEVPSNVSDINIEFDDNSFNKLKFIGYFDQTTNELIISEGRNPLRFTMSNNVEVNNTTVKPIDKKFQKQWSYPGMPVVEDVYDYDQYTDSASVMVDSAAVAFDYSEETPKYVFKLKIEKTFDESLKVAKASPEKTLMVFYDNNKEATKDFIDYVESYESYVQNYMYEEYDPEHDKLNFYLATDKDKNALKKLGVTDNESVIFINSEGTKLYHAKGKMNDDDFSYYSLPYIINEIDAVNANAKLDAVLINKKSTIAQTEKALLNLVNNGKNNYSYVTPPPAPSYKEERTVDAVKEVAVQAVDAAAEAVDSAVAVYDDYNDNMLKEKDNIYRLKVSQDVVNAKYKQVLDSHLNDKHVNSDLVTIILSELSNYKGFTYKLFNKYEQKLSLSDFQSIDYLLKFFTEIQEIKTEDGYQNYTADFLINTISESLDREANATQIEKVKEYYNKLIQSSNNNPRALKNLIYTLKNNGSKNEYLTAYDNYFKSIVKPNTNLIEELDKVYQLENASDWSYFKSEFADSANEAAWFVVENSKDLSDIQKAIKWSETSLQVQKEVHYYLDTLAQLYYKNGEKQKGIQFEQKAIEVVKSDPDGNDQLEEYNNVLEKMKNGTY